MRPHTPLFRLTASTAITALLLVPVLPTPALAQMGSAVVAASQQQTGDPPARVGRLARTTGSVSFHTPEADQWSPAQANYPVTSGDAFWTEPNAQAELQIGASRIQLAGSTEFIVGTLDQNGMQATQGEGEAYLHLSRIAPGEAWSVQTPRGTVMLSGDGRYVILAGDTQTPTTVTVLEGGAQVTGPGLNLQVRPGQAATITGTDMFQGSLGPAQPDAFVAAVLASERPLPSPAVAPPPIVASMPGGDDLAAYGSWSDSPNYGAVWYPQVAAGWVPYREGHWAWVAPWGWTWVDDAPWGFAPFHYGRWVEIGGRWAWTPGMVAVAGPPVYAPALVTFFGLAAGAAVGVALASGSIGWCPLGPHEAYHPWYHVSDRYWRALNIHAVRNITTINRTVVIDRYVNRSAATVVPARVLQASRPVRQAAVRVDPRALGQARPVVGREPVAPSRATFGVTAATARQTRLAPVPPGAAALHAAPGPAIRPAAMPEGARLQPDRQARPALATPRQPVQPAQVRPTLPSGAPGHPGVTQLRPAAPTGAAVPAHAPPLLHPGERPAVVAPREGGATPRYQAPAAIPGIHQATPTHPGAPVPQATVVPHVQTPAGRPAPAYHAPAPAQQYRQPAQPTPHVYHPLAGNAPQYHPPAQVAPRAYRPPPVAAPHVQAPVHVAPAPQYHPPQMRAAPRPAPAQHAPQQERQNRPGEH